MNPERLKHFQQHLQSEESYEMRSQYHLAKSDNKLYTFLGKKLINLLTIVFGVLVLEGKCIF